ncbi:MAG: hypothetical protein GC199_10720 [Alphaproteobacteria bacterium]|nr:hypothetical protein [Alphaproteobacteria bacterium]
MTASGPKVRLYRFRNRLKDKLGGGPGPFTLPEDALAKVQEAFDKMSEDYPDWVAQNITQLREMHARCVDTPASRAKIFLEIQSLAHDMKGQGGTFGYHLITSFAASLYDFTGPKATISDSHVELVKAHLDAMSAVIKGRIKGNGGKIGIELSTQLNEAIARCDNEPSSA